MYLPCQCTVSPNPTTKCWPGVDKGTQNMNNFINYVKNIVYPNGIANCHMLNKYFCSRFNDKN